MILTKLLDARFAPPPTEAEIAAFETRYNIQLPEDYRAFLLEIGDGKRCDNSPGPWHSCFYSLQDICSDLEEYMGGDPAQEFPHNGPCDSFDQNDFYEWDAGLHGTIAIGSAGCTIEYRLIITGSERGNIWLSDWAGWIKPMVFLDIDGFWYHPIEYENRPKFAEAADLPHVTFTEWYADWLDYVIAVLQAGDD